MMVREGRPYRRELDLESHADYPAEVAEWYETMAREVMRTLAAAEARGRVASDDALWRGPRPS
ncbi:MAG TPA: hypothetical protein VIG07_19595 [Methylomirabilota bacterium]|jgi:hypothetical protein